ncbi:hypothetical protein WG923_23165 [Ramlibacter sp. AN1133]|uniref:hypothetical protein n=1 Tax=Ramlibacter sp. AN1133 TaxID=3133429 RepID=UPI0030C4C48A
MITLAALVVPGFASDRVLEDLSGPFARMRAHDVKSLERLWHQVNIALAVRLAAVSLSAPEGPDALYARRRRSEVDVTPAKCNDLLRSHPAVEREEEIGVNAFVKARLHLGQHAIPLAPGQWVRLLLDDGHVLDFRDRCQGGAGAAVFHAEDAPQGNHVVVVLLGALPVEAADLRFGHLVVDLADGGVGAEHASPEPDCGAVLVLRRCGEPALRLQPKLRKFAEDVFALRRSLGCARRVRKVLRIVERASVYRLLHVAREASGELHVCWRRQ